MINRGAQRNKKNFDSLLSESINESLAILLDQAAMKSFISFLNNNYRVKEKEIGKNLDIFSSELEKIFGVNASKIEKMIVALLFSKLRLDYKENEAFKLEDYVKEARVKSVVVSDLYVSEQPLDDKDLRVIHSLEDDARKTVTQIAKETGLSRPTVTNMIDRMIKQNLLQIKAGINIRELGFPTACLALECKLMDQRKDLVRSLSMCPRVLMILEPSEKVNLLVFLYGEDQTTLKSTIESFRHFSGANLVDILHSGPPTVPSTFNLPVFIEKGESTPCGKACVDCVNYINNECVGCPVVNIYTGPL
jgi:Lrp/AsnC family leucine-responsive transcriptional regulator